MLFSIVTVSYNAERFIDETLSSVFAQSEQDYEIIVVDGASKDSTCDRLRYYETQYPGRLRWFSEPDKGIYDAMNKGIALSQGDYVNFLNCGDTYAPEALAQMAQAIHEHPEADVLYGISRYLDDAGEVHLIREHHTRFRERNICHQSIWYRRTVFAKHGTYDLDYPIMADYDLNIRLFQAGLSFIPVDSILVNYSLTGLSNNSDNLEKSQKETMTIYYRHGMVDKAHYTWFMGSFTRQRLLSKLKNTVRKSYYLLYRFFHSSPRN